MKDRGVLGLARSWNIIYCTCVHSAESKTWGRVQGTFRPREQASHSASLLTGQFTSHEPDLWNSHPVWLLVRWGNLSKRRKMTDSRSYYYFVPKLRQVFLLVTDLRKAEWGIASLLSLHSLCIHSFLWHCVGAGGEGPSSDLKYKI